MLLKTDFDLSVSTWKTACDFLGMIIPSHGGICAAFLFAWVKPLAVSSNLVKITEPAAAQSLNHPCIYTHFVFLLWRLPAAE